MNSELDTFLEIILGKPIKKYQITFYKDGIETPENLRIKLILLNG
jgi:hypothetical protein